ncbi:DNA repair protein RadC [Mameliella sp. AT18]|uniref:JAB domain-containing protein n=1 Tax=Mameliella sp. AT18 TaxID=3028385 RepID=UPI00237B5307|nr:DNA repair protein RadC [Mameliella sp. AT18]MDD9732520.1 DNA repair protein RadC [Mameliella sp. AT18]
MTHQDPKEITERPSSGFSEAEIATIDAAREILRRHARSTAALQSWGMLTDYLALNAVRERVEVFRVLLLDRKNRLIRDRIMTRGSIDHVPVYVSEVLRSALVLDASAIIMCHNHPSGDPEPSQADIDLTRKIVEACKVMEIVVHDHIIVGFGREKNAFSMRAAGMLSD